MYLWRALLCGTFPLRTTSHPLNVCQKSSSYLYIHLPTFSWCLFYISSAFPALHRFYTLLLRNLNWFVQRRRVSKITLEGRLPKKNFFRNFFLVRNSTITHKCRSTSSSSFCFCSWLKWKKSVFGFLPLILLYIFLRFSFSKIKSY